MINSNLQSTALLNHETYTSFNENLNMADCISELIEEILDLTSFENPREITPRFGIFNAKKSPKISIRHYVGRFQKYTLFSEEVFVCALIYIDRVMFAFPRMTLSPANVHSIIIAAKQVQDQLESQAHLARVAGISPEQLMKLELSLLDMLEWKTHIDQKQFLIYIEKLSERNQAKLSPTAITPQALEDLQKKPTISRVKLSDVSTIQTASQTSNQNDVTKIRSLSMPYNQEEADEMDSLINQVSKVFFS